MRMKRQEAVGAVWSDDLSSPNALGKRGTVAGTLATAAGPLGKKTATYFGGVGSYSQRSPQFGTGSFTVEVWANSDDTTQSGRGIVTNNTGVGGTGTGWWIYFNGGSVFAYVDDGTNWRFVASGDIANNTWHHIALVVDRTANVVRLYVDGILKSTSATIAGFGTFDQSTMYVGRGQNTFNGAASEPKLWGRALSTAEVLAIKEATVFRYWESLISRWNMSDPNTPDLGFRKLGYDLTGVGLDNTNIVRGPYGGKATLFDGASEYSSRAVSDWRSGDSVGAFSFLLKSNVGAFGCIFCTSDEAGASNYLVFEKTATGEIRIDTKIAGVRQVVDSAVALGVGEWLPVVVTTDGSAWKVYIDGVAQVMTVVVGANTGTWLDSVPGRDNIVFGVIKHSGLTDYYGGCIASASYYNAELLNIQAADLAARLKEGKA